MRDTEPTSPALERHYTVKQVAELWGVSENTVRTIFRDMPGVLKIANPRLLRRERKRAVPVSLRIPESALKRAHDLWSGAAPDEPRPRRSSR
jgi:hypothetical protein